MNSEVPWYSNGGVIQKNVRPNVMYWNQYLKSVSLSNWNH